MSLEEAWRFLTAALESRTVAPPLLAQQPWDGEAADALLALIQDPARPAALRIAAAVIADRPGEAPGTPETDAARQWQAIALRRAGRFAEARRCFRELGARLSDPQLFERALVVLGFAAAGFRWAGSARTLLMARGAWDPVWFVDACAAVDAGILSRETAALLEEMQRAELELLLLDGDAD